MTTDPKLTHVHLKKILGRRLVKWVGLVLAGVIAYGVGIYQGYQSYKKEQSLEFPRQGMESKVLPQTLPSDTPKNTAIPKSPTTPH